MLSFANAIGNYYNRIGKHGLLLKQYTTYLTAQLSNMTDTTNGIVAQFNSESDVQAIIGGSYISILSSSNSLYSTTRSSAIATVNRMIFRDNPQLGQTLTSFNTITSLNEVIRQMKIAGASVLAMGVTAVPTGFTGIGNGVINSSVKRALDGKVLENSFSENLLLVCSGDSYSGNVLAGNEPFVVTGVGSQGDVTAFNWPLGSNCSTQLQAIDGSQNNTSGNILTNSGFDAWTSNVPDNFTLDVGTAGTNILQESGITYDGADCAAIVGDSAGTLTQIRQIFDDSAGTLGTLQNLTQYSFNIFIRRDGTAAVTGVLTIELVDQNGTVIQDQNAVSNTFNIDLTALTTVFTSYTAIFRTPLVMPTDSYLRFRLSTALEDGRIVYLDRASLGLMTQCYTSGPSLAIHSGHIPFAQGDFGNCQITNSRGVGGTLDTFQTLIQRLFFPEVMGNELLLPSSSTPTISDTNLIA